MTSWVPAHLERVERLLRRLGCRLRRRWVHISGRPPDRDGLAQQLHLLAWQSRRSTIDRCLPSRWADISSCNCGVEEAGGLLRQATSLIKNRQQSLLRSS